VTPPRPPDPIPAFQPRTAFFLLLAALGCGFGSLSCGPALTGSAPGPVTLTYWEKWNGFEGAAVQAMVDRYNQKQSKVFVKVVTVSEIEKKLLVATAGGDPPDLSGLYSRNVAVYAERGALENLDRGLADRGVALGHFLPVYLLECRLRGSTYALPIAGMTLGLHYNRAHFREAGLDPDKPPRTMAELLEVADKLTIRNKDGSYKRLGFLPTDPGWWNWSWLYYTGGSLFNEDTRRLTADTPENRRALQWFADFSEKYGVEKLTAFHGGLGSFSSPQNPFLAGKVSMEIQGVWMNSFIHTFNPKLDWGVAPFPAWVPGRESMTLIESDVLVVPTGSRHPKEALDYIAYAVGPEGQEILHTKMAKFPMLKPKYISKDFWAKNPNPYIRVYQKLAESPNAFTAPRIGPGQEYFDEATVVFDEVWLHRKTPAEALEDLQARMGKKWDREVRRLQRLGLKP